MIDSRCGLHCTGCPWKSSHGCGGCIETAGRPFHGECPIALCCQQKGHTHCGECDAIPCSQLYAYSYLDPEHGDTPPGSRVQACRRWAAEKGKMAWDRVLLTESGLAHEQACTNEWIASLVYPMLDRPAQHTRVLLVGVYSSAEFGSIPRHLQGLANAGFLAEHIEIFNPGAPPSETQAMQYGLVYLAGDSAAALLELLNTSGLGSLLKKMVYHQIPFVGAGSGSLVAGPNIGPLSQQNTAALCLANAHLHTSAEPPPQGAPSRLERILLSSRLAVQVSWQGHRTLSPPSKV